MLSHMEFGNFFLVNWTLYGINGHFVKQYWMQQHMHSSKIYTGYLELSPKIFIMFICKYQMSASWVDLWKFYSDECS